MLKNTKNALKKAPLLADLSDEEVDLLSKVAVLKKFEKNEIIIHRQDVGDTFFTLLDGAVKVVLDDDEGKEFIVGILRENDFFGELSLLDGGPRSASVIAIEPTEVVALRREDFLRQMEQQPQMAIKLLTELGRRLRKANEHIESLAFLDVCGRLARFLLEIAPDAKDEKSGRLIVKVTHSRTELANIIGTTRETLTRALKTLETMGYIQINKNEFTILNTGGLRNRI